MSYQLAAGHNNAAGLVVLQNILVSGKILGSRLSSIGSFVTGREIEYLDGTIQDDGFDAWEWTFNGLTIAEYAYFKTTFLAGARSGKVTAQTRLNEGAFVVRNATLTLPRSPRLVGEKYGDVVLSFTRGAAL